MIIRSLISTILVSTSLLAATHTGRVSLGSFVSSEKYKDAITGSTSNDALLFSSRYYHKVIGLTDRRSEFIADIRDKHDLFDKVDNEKLELKSKNTLQIRELSYRHKGLTFGRFALNAAGGVYTDGVSFRFAPWSNFKLSLFGGLNPKRTDQTDLEYNPDSKIAGAYSTYQINPKSWHNYFHLTNGFTLIREDGKNERAFLYHNLIYQQSPTNRFISLVYLEFIPKTYIQNMMLSHQYGWSEKISTNSSLYIHDTTTYVRIQGVRERLDPSTYKEGRVGFKYKLNSPTSLKLRALYGKRELDNKTKIEVRAGGSTLVSKDLVLNSYIGGRKNFDVDNGFLKLGATYFTKAVELDFNQELMVERRASESDDYPTVTTLSLTNFHSRSFLTTASLQYSRDNQVDILTLFVRASYMFGNSGRGPLRGTL